MIAELIHSPGLLLLSMATVLPLSSSPRWWIRSLDFPRLQFFLLTVFLVFVQLLFCHYPPLLHYGLLGLSACIVVYQFSWIYPYTRFAPTETRWCEQTDADRTVSILCANVLTPNRNADALIDIVHNARPDLLITLETDLWWQEHLAPLEKDYPHCVKWPLDNLFGMHLYSRLPLQEEEAKYLVEDGIPSIHCRVRLPSGQTVRCHFLHPTPPVPEFNEESTERDAELIVVAKSVSKTVEPTIVAGDLNDVAWSETTRLFRKISGFLDPRIGRGLFNTFHAKYWPLRWPLDHLFHSPHFCLSRIQRMPYFGSDHFALFTELVLQDAPEDEQAGIEASIEDEEVAQQKIEEAEVSEKEVPL